MLGMVCLRRMNERPCIAYEIMAPNTAMFSSVPPINAPPASAPRRNHTDSMMPNPSTVPEYSAVCGTLCLPWVTDMNGR
jgi:hypothetical protein